MGVLVGVFVGDGIDVNVAVGIGVDVSVGGANVEVTGTGPTVGVDAGAQPVRKIIKIKMIVITFFMQVIYYSLFHSINLIASRSLVGSRVNLSLRPSRL